MPAWYGTIPAMVGYGMVVGKAVQTPRTVGAHPVPIYSKQLMNRVLERLPQAFTCIHLYNSSLDHLLFLLLACWIIHDSVALVDFFNAP